MCDSPGKHGLNPGPLSSMLEVIFKEGLSECQPHCQSLKPGTETGQEEPWRNGNAWQVE